MNVPATALADFKSKGIDISDTRYFTYITEADLPVAGGFRVTATGTATFTSDPAGASIQYDFNPTATPPSSWTPGGIITNDMLPPGP